MEHHQANEHLYHRHPKKEEKRAERLLKEIIAKIFPNLEKEIDIQVQVVQRTPSKINWEITPKHIIIKTLKIENKERILKAARKEWLITYKGTPHHRAISRFSCRNHEIRREWDDVFKVLKGKTANQEYYSFGFLDPIPREGGVFSHIPPCKSRMLPYFWPTSYRSEIPTSLSLVLVNLLEQLTELRETFYLLDNQFITKACNSGIARWKRCIGQSLRKGCRASIPSSGISLFHISMCSPVWKLSKVRAFGFLWWLHYTGMID